MNSKLLEDARLAADRFSETVDALTTQQRLQKLPDGEGYYDGGKLTAAVRRKSMDLTRALSAPRPEENDALKVRVAELEAALRLLARRPPGLGVYKDNELISINLLVGDIRHAVAVLERSKPCEH